MVINKEKDTGGIDKNIKMTAEDSTKLFENFVQAQTCIQVISTFQNLCEAVALQYPPSQSSSSAQCSFYPRLKNSLSSSWRAKSLFGKLDKRYLCKEYFADQRLYKSGSRRAAEDLKVLIIGAGPCGLRTAIEMACLGAKTVVVEKRDTFSRNNVLHLWPYIITDLKTLGAKKFYGKFCAGAIDHISIRQLQLILLKIALILGVEVVFNVSFEGLCPPTQTEASQTANKGWTARVSPSNHSLRNYEFDVVVGADGKRNTLQGFKRKEFRGKLAIGLTVNFINRHTTAEAKVEEISGVAYIFNQQFFKDLQSETGIDLENIVYYKGETHYFVMTAKKHSLVSKGVLKQDYDNTNELLCYNNIDQEELMKYAKEAADFSTRHQLPHLDFAINQYGQSDIALFDFTCMYAAENAALFRETYRQKLLCCLVGDSLLEPFWPMGTGCARGFLAAFDLVWMTKQLALKRKCSNYDPNDNKVELAVLAERESIYRVLHQTTPQNTMKNHQDYTIAPSTRYANLNLKAVTPSQVKPLYISDQPINDELDIVDTEATPMVVDLVEPPNVHKSFLTRKVSMVRPSKLLSWCQKMTEGYPGVEVNDLTSSWRNGLALCAIVHRYRPDLIEWSQLTHTNIQTNNQLAFDAAEQHLGISPVMTGKEMAEKPEVDHLMMLTYISQFYEVFKNEKPSDLKSNVNAESGEVPTTPTSPSGLSSTSPFGLITRLLSKKRSLHDNQEKTGKKKKFTGPFHKKKTNSPEPEVVQNKENQSTARKDVITVGGTDVKLRPKTSTSDSKLVSDRASNRISALSNQLISQWQQNGSETRSNPKHNLTPKPSASDKCYFCDRRVYIVERLSAEGFFFHRQCFVCTHCGVTLRRGGYEFDKESGKFYCRAHYFAHSENFKMAAAKPQKQAVRKSSESDDKITPLPSDGVKLLKPIQAGSYRTPERIELENIHHFMLNDQQELSEEAVNKHNLSGTYDKSNVAADSEYMSDSSDEDIDWEAVLKEAMQDHDPSESEIDSDDDRDYDTSSRGSCLHNITTLSYLEESYLNQSVNSVCDETMADITDESEELDTSDFSHVSSDDEKVKKAQSLSTSSSASPLDDDTQELVTKYNQVLDEKQNDENVDTDVAKTENFKDKQGVQTLSNGDTAAGLKSVSLSSISTESLSDNADVPQSPLKPKLDQQINTATATTKPSGELENTDLCNDDENKQTADVSTHQAAMPDKKPRTVFGILSSPVSEVKDLPSGHKEEPEKIAAKNIENVKPKEAESTEEINGQHHMQRFDTLDRVENYLNKTPVGINDSITEEKFMINRSEDGLSLSDASVDEDIELSSNSSSSGSELNTAQLDVSDLIKDNSDKKSCPPDASLLKDKLGKQPVSSEQKRTFPRLPSTESIMIRASFTGKGNNTSVWSNLDNESMTSEKDVTRPTPRPRSTAFCDSSFISNYRPGPDSTLSSDETKVSAAPTERKSSFDSLELQMKLRLRARKKWFRQESLTSKQNKEHSSPSQPSVADSGISLRDKDASSPDVAEDEPPTYNSTLSNQVDVIVTEPNTPNNQSHSRSKSFDSDNDQFFTPPSRRNPQSGVMNPISPTSGRTRPPTSRQRSFLDVTDDFVSAPTTPLNPRVLPSAPSNTRRALPALPKVAHLEALSPTGSPQSPQTKKSIDEEMRAREIRVNERVAKMKESSLRNRSGSDITKTSCSSIDEADLLSIMREFRDDDVIDHHSNEPAYSGISPKPKRKSSFRHKFKRLSKKKVDSNSEDSERVRRSLPIPNLSADVVTGSSSAFDSASKSESPGKKKKTKQRKSKTKLVLPDAPGNDNSGTKKHSPGKRGLFRISPRKKEKKILPDVGDGRSTLERKYETASEREKAIVRGERFRVLPQLPTVPVRESEKSWKEIDRLL
uniref:protein-methionine sulfoxide oxidase mical3b isoform X4 n=1 Tax=Ciona intestinalis TaxID=7719 RepID=UPI0005215822|nr:protein-methionine sulfoxide oxidase mical3b isoform X4 [Ciona intestinalis]|eukprot:XP_026696714.1 protein-methionine sulfoxide oxidase mical3b isoform X4 [Ciona intestinalis]